MAYRKRAVNMKPLVDFYRIYCVCLLICISLILSGCESEIATGLSNDGSLRLLADLAEGGITASRHPEGKGKDTNWRIIVESAERQEALAILNRLKPVGFGDEEGGRNESLLGDAESNRDHRVEKIAAALERSLEQLPRVREVRVHLALKQARGAMLSESSANRSESDSAAVLLTTYPHGNLDTEKISQLVSGATGISQEAIAVVVNELPVRLFSTVEGLHTAELGLDKSGNDEAGNDKSGNDKAGIDESGIDKSDSGKAGDEVIANGYGDPKVIFITLTVVVTLIVLSRGVLKLVRPIKLVVDEKC